MRAGGGTQRAPGRTVRAESPLAPRHRLASASADKTARVWRVADGGLVATLTGHRGGVSDCAWSAGSDYLATASDDKTLGLWDARTGKLLRQLTGHTAFVFCCNFNAHSNQLARPPPQSAARGLPRVLRSQPGRL